MMNLVSLKNKFYQQVYPSKPNDWEVEDVLERLLGLPTELQHELLKHVPAVWPVSHSLCFSYLEYGAIHINRLGVEFLPEWIRQFLDRYEIIGLAGARRFMAEVEESFFGRLAGTAGARLEDVRRKLVPFIRGVSGQNLELAAAREAWTDTSTIYLPESVNLFREQQENQRFYIFLACCQWGYVVSGSLRTELTRKISELLETSQQGRGDQARIEEFFDTFEDPGFAHNLYHFLEFSYVYLMLTRELPGLMRNIKPLLLRLLGEDGATADQRPKGIFHPRLLGLFHMQRPSGELVAEYRLADDRDRRLELFFRLYLEFSANGAEDDWGRFGGITGGLYFDKVRERVARRRVEEKQAFIQQLAGLIEQVRRQDGGVGEKDGVSGAEAAEVSRLVVALSEAEGKSDAREVLQIDNEEVELSSELVELFSRITRDLGHIPEGYVQAAAGIAGRALLSGDEREHQLRETREAILYDEWDFRRQGYRKNWCSLIEKDVQPVRSRFIAQTHSRYRGLMVRLRRQFEMLRTQHRFVRRRRYGDDIDFDALVDALGDRKAGITPSDRLFIRLLRDERDIAVLFLVDMSNSTEGWVGRAIKEALVLLCDVLEIVRDRYGIYGFSGMRRSRCELFRIKEIDEPFSELVQQRICAISPREYTRMAPPIRHLTRSLVELDARVRLLITISDGKPEDYDEYRGEYAIEDTRQALIEARGKGVIPFCITVDREAHSYLAHMYGRGNYIYVDRVEKLPGRMPEIYRLMTS